MSWKWHKKPHWVYLPGPYYPLIVASVKSIAKALGKEAARQAVLEAEANG